MFNLKNKHIIVLGIRGIPAQHGGFETFAEYLCLFLIERDWNVTVYCQEDGTGSLYESEWKGIKRIHIPINNTGPLGTIIFDLKSVIHSLRSNGVFLTLGYNTAIFNVLHRLKGKQNIINMDGIWMFFARYMYWFKSKLITSLNCFFERFLCAPHKSKVATKIHMLTIK